MGELPVHSVETSVLLYVQGTVQKGQTVGTDIFTAELDVEIHCVEVLSESFNFLCLDFDPGVIHVFEPVAGGCSLVRAQGAALNFLHVKVHHDWRHR